MINIYKKNSVKNEKAKAKLMKTIDDCIEMERPSVWMNEVIAFLVRQSLLIRMLKSDSGATAIDVAEPNIRQQVMAEPETETMEISLLIKKTNHEKHDDGLWCYEYIFIYICYIVTKIIITKNIKKRVKMYEKNKQQQS